jgi:hypothetical protein
MKRFVVFVMMVALLSDPAFAGKNSQTVAVPSAIKAGPTMLVPGDYNVTWTGSGPNVQVTFAQGKKAVVTLPAKLVEENNRNDVELDIDSRTGVEVLRAIRTRNMTLLFNDSAASSGN